MKNKRLSRPKVPSKRLRASHLGTFSVVVQSLGAQGDGVAELNGCPIHIPGGLPGEVVSIEVEKPPGAKEALARLRSVEAPSAERVSPVCPCFGRCGGCRTQHFSAEAERRWKGDLAGRSLIHRGLSAEALAAPLVLPPGTRRRATFFWTCRKNDVVLGFSARKSHALVNIGSCPVLRPEIESILPIVRKMLGSLDLLPGSFGDVSICLADNGLDFRLDLPVPPSLAQRETLAAFAERLDCARLVLRIDEVLEPLVIRRSPFLRLGDVEVFLPPAVFLQPSKEGEEALQSLVLSALEDVDGAIADLFCGIGTFSLPLVREKRKICSWDSDGAAVAALARTCRVEAKTRDLFRAPLEKEELSKFSAVVLDPPRAGAKNQCALLARYGPPRLVMASCNPATFARDARLLADGGYALRRVVPVDQFRWSEHLEIVATFSRLP